MKVLYIGPLQHAGTCLQRYHALCDLGHIVYPFDTEYYFPSEYRGLHTVVRKLGWGPRLWKMNRDIVTTAKKFVLDIIWLDKAGLVSPGALMSCKGLKGFPLLVHYSPDDMMNPHNQSRFYLRSIAMYDAHVTTKSYNVDELKGLGAQKVYFINNAYCSHLHRPVQVSAAESETYGSRIGFIGTYEAERARSMVKMAEAGYKLRIWGAGWERQKWVCHPNLRVEKQTLRGEEYVRAICSTDINLCFLRKVNRDRQTTRSMEVPACGGFMLAERTDEHQWLFEENSEAAYFSSDEELMEKLQYYIGHPEERRRIAAAGRQRCVRSGYSNREVLKSLLEKITNNCFRRQSSVSLNWRPDIELDYE